MPSKYEMRFLPAYRSVKESCGRSDGYIEITDQMQVEMALVKLSPFDSTRLRSGNKCAAN
jgi:hypothetical protein